ncbi:polygalacturonase ADPG1-like [Ricinus communis]|uniref:polygalacturonase ADPG1-like n=1 Tax=Ricinus communis TaxID=3988 RepID=UPI00201ACD15|nr:polygalacturonase ADPG1-like [Ricinus communis]
MAEKSLQILSFTGTVFADISDLLQEFSFINPSFLPKFDILPNVLDLLCQKYIPVLLDLLSIVYMLSLGSAMFSVAWSQRKYNVLSYGAVGNGIVDDTMAFMKAWNDTCKDSRRPVMVVPMGKTFLVYPVTLFGPCNSSNLIVMILGTIIAPDHPNVWNGRFHGTWLAFRYVNDLTVSGNGVGVLDGRGHRWWEISCRYNKSKDCNILSPTIISFEMCKNVNLRRISTVRSGGGHIAVFGCENVRFSILNLQSPGKSPNTDGIHISHSNFVHIHKSVIGSGDDCISMLDRSYNVNITNINCGPGHGISIGSLGSDGTKVDVQNITIRNVNFYKTTNGARIKTWQEGRGRVRNVEFSNINLTDVKNPIIIDQHYGEPKNAPPKKTKNGVHITEVRYSGFVGTSMTDVAINFNCSENVPCTDISLENIRLAKSGKSRKKVSASCNNAHGFAKGVVVPASCLVY